MNSANRNQLPACQMSCSNVGAIITDSVGNKCVCKAPEQQTGNQDPISNQAPNAGAGFSCQELQSQYQQCVQLEDAAKTTCDQDKNSSLSTAKSVVSSLGPAANVMGVVNACQKIGQAVAATQAGLAAFKTDCEEAQSKCLDSCGNILNQINSKCGLGNDPNTTAAIRKNSADEVGAHIQSCQSLTQKTMEAESAIGSLINSARQASNCSSDAGGGMQAAIPTMDCSNPQIAATDLVCICSRTPQDTRCAGVSGKLGFGGTRNSPLGGATLSNPSGKIDASGLDLSSSTNAASLGAAGKVDGEIPGGRQGGAGLGDSGGSLAGGAGVGGAGVATGSDPSDKTHINAGFLGSGGASGSGYYGSGGTGGANYNSNVNNGYQKYNGGFDPSKYLPGKYDPKRSIAGAVGADGLTGPNSMIWDKISNRYRSKMSSMRP